jgi:hypothetical protein
MTAEPADQIWIFFQSPDRNFHTMIADNNTT